MSAVTVSPKYQVVIPKQIRERMGILPGQKLEVIALDNQIVFVPVQQARQMRGLLMGMDPTIERDPDRI